MADPKISECILTPTSLTLYFVGHAPMPSPGDLELIIYGVTDGVFVQHDFNGDPPPTAQPDIRAISWVFASSITGDHVSVIVRLASSGTQLLSQNFDMRKERFVADTPPVTPGSQGGGHDSARATQAMEDAVSYAILTENLNGAPSSITPISRLSGPESGGAQLVGQTLRDVLGWKVRDDDPKGFAGALMSSFAISDIEGHTEWTYTPRTYAVQSDLQGGITGAQASLYKRAQEALGQALPLLDGLYPLDPDADAEDITAVKAVLRKQLLELVGELGAPGGPGVARVDHFFNLLLATPSEPYSILNGTQLRDPEPDHLAGTLGRLRDLLGLSFGEDFVNSIEDEQNQTNYRVLCDYVTSLAQSWLSNQRFFGLSSSTPFLGTQLVPISRQLSVIAESVDEVRFTLDSVFIGAAERQTLQLSFGDVSQPMYAEDFFRWIQNFVTDEAPAYVQDGGKFGIGNSVVPFAHQLQSMTQALVHKHDQPKKLPPGFYTARVQRAILSLSDELKELVRLARPLRRDVSVAPAPVKVQAAFNAVRIGVRDGMLSFRHDNSTPISTLYNLSDTPLYIGTDTSDNVNLAIKWRGFDPTTMVLGGKGSAQFHVLTKTPKVQGYVKFMAYLDDPTGGGTPDAVATVEVALAPPDVIGFPAFQAAN
ncbi:hypothetical protein PPGU19_065800 (plasmid) [Paraburkholderia sp. PGU19]|uniref:hypothetical protein n=1 Tax=Paraburkholderia sp. PGU19 TaxID=2735434 RepID=UPI0015DB0360|nr:hypothetical protein [Paraburkholderia sp. PGU19]BCG02012.1 hypothetical protein PPGU19_065800 [Paraburkholderia sp. PGU19]